ncbi:MAG: hypothetical protein C5B60_02020 [Chloroflexi bacterium]|nr:MAG: hypothetical protein C5B60_02020 [Chloroflexota bacterium]
MSDETEKKIADLQRQIDELRAQVKPPDKFVPRAQMERFDPTASMTMPASAMKPMVDVIQDRKDLKFDRDAWARNSYPQPGGFGPPTGPAPTREVERSSGWQEPQRLEPQIKGKYWSK